MAVVVNPGLDRSAPRSESGHIATPPFEVVVIVDGALPDWWRMSVANTQLAQGVTIEQLLQCLLEISLHQHVMTQELTQSLKTTTKELLDLKTGRADDWADVLAPTPSDGGPAMDYLMLVAAHVPQCKGGSRVSGHGQVPKGSST
ncbi:hypothetical protein QTP86_004750 [Hemibagrus guttatus]|nr:hypothetical protein QTP86_004750 [Hemibagrus guttatus]